MFIRIFYSTQCSESMNLLQVIRNENITKMFILVCLDKYRSKDIQNLCIKKLPAIVISAENRKSEIYEGSQMCSQWLNNFTLCRRQNLAQQVEKQRRLVQKTQADARKQEGGVLEYIESEMDGVADNYAYNHTELCQPKSFVMIGDEDKYNIMTPHVVEGKIDFNAMSRQISAVEANRKNDTNQFKQIMENNQIKTVINYQMQ